MKRYYVGTASWSLPKQLQPLFPEGKSILSRYAQSFNSVEINSSFYREHQAKTYQRWAEAVPKDFRFSVKLSKIFTHESGLEETKSLPSVLEPIHALNEKLGVLLLQLPPKLVFAPKVVKRFFTALRKSAQTKVVIEPRHPSWLDQDALQLLADFAVSPVIADPSRIDWESRTKEISFSGIRYFRLHGSPEIYRSSYEGAALKSWVSQMNLASQEEIWCIFDNTTFGHATENALQTKAMLESRIIHVSEIRNQGRSSRFPA